MAERPGVRRAVGRAEPGGRVPKRRTIPSAQLVAERRRHPDGGFREPWSTVSSIALNTVPSPFPPQVPIQSPIRAPADAVSCGMLSDVKLALVTQLLEWLRPFFESFGYVIVSVAMFFESAAFTGILVPGDVILAIGGVYAGRRESSRSCGVIACGAFFGVLGTSAGYLLGRRYGDAVAAARADPPAVRGPRHPGAGVDRRERRQDDRARAIRHRRRGLRSVRRRVLGGPTADVLRLRRPDDGRLGRRASRCSASSSATTSERSIGSSPASAWRASAWASGRRVLDLAAPTRVASAKRSPRTTSRREGTRRREPLTSRTRRPVGLTCFGTAD